MATVIFKPTERCNAACIYCDVVKKEVRGAKRMSSELLELTFRRINEFLVERPQESMEIIWHGGEPMLLGPGYFEQALHYQEKHCSGTAARITHKIQSNLTLLSRKFLEPMRKLGIGSIGTSYDPHHGVRGLGLRRDSRAYNRRFMEAIEMLEQEGFGWGVIYVVTRHSLARPLDVFNFFANLSPKGSFRFNPVLIYGSGLDQIRITPAEFVEFLGAIFPTWWRNRGEFAQVEPFSSLVLNLTGQGRVLTCADSGACARTHINLGPDGRVSHCGRSADFNLLDYGSIFDKSLSEIYADRQREVLVGRNDVLSQGECAGCRFWEICHGGCPLDGWSQSGSFLRKSEWCEAKKDLIEKHIEPVLQADAAPAPEATTVSPAVCAAKRVEIDGNDGDPLWINPIGGLGDALMISSVLKQASERFPQRKYNLVDRTKYREILQGHPAIGQIGHPPPGAKFIGTDYWYHEEHQRPGARAYQVLARIFGLETPIEERLYVPWEFTDDPILMARIPWSRKNVLICQSSNSPRKQMSVDRWQALVGMLAAAGIGVVQAGKLGDDYVRRAYSLLGLTTPRQLVSLLGHFDAVVTSDNFVMHASRLRDVPAVVLWGPTDHKIYGYDQQIHLQAEPDCSYPGGCIRPGIARAYPTDCPSGSAHCMNTLSVEAIGAAVMAALREPVPRASSRPC